MDEEEPAITNVTVQERPVTLVDLTCDEDDSVNAPLSGEVVLNLKNIQILYGCIISDCVFYYYRIYQAANVVGVRKTMTGKHCACM